MRDTFYIILPFWQRKLSWHNLGLQKKQKDKFNKR